MPARRSGATMPMTGSLTVYPRVENGKVVTMPPYDPLYDPHLADFFAKKLNQAPSPPMKRSWSATGYRGGANSGSGITFNKTQRFSSAHPTFSRGTMHRGPKSSSKRKSGKGDVMYKITVRTGDVKGGGTDARVFMRIIGRRGKVSKWRICKKSGQSNVKMFRFAKGSSHIFKHKGADIGEIQKVIIEHDGISERDSWFLKEVIVEDTKYDKTYTFPCDRWLSLYKEDCQTTRHLSAVSGRQSKRITYEVTTVTGEKRGAGTDANVFVTFYGSKGTSPKLNLKSDGRKKFERGQSDVFKVRTVNVGALKRLRIEIDNQGFAPAWFLERVVVMDLSKPSQRIFFPCGQWLSDDEQLYRDLIGSGDPLDRAKMNSYVIHTFTGDVRRAGTDANVYVTLFGSNGDSGQKFLDNNKNNFERGRKDSFTVECPHLGKLKKIRIGHDNSGASAGWFLDKVVVDDSMMSCVYTFPCERWFAKDEDDGRITRELVAGKGDAGIPYTVQLFTGDVRGAGTDAEVYIVLFGGRKGQQSSGKIILDGKFERNRVDVCNVESASMLSPLDKIEIGHDNSGAAAGWFLDKVVVTCNSTGCEQVFSCRKWFASDEGDGLITRELYESKSLRKQVQQKTAWNCVIFTSDVRNAGTDAKVFIQVYGEKGKSDVIPLNNETDNFETGQKDKFKIDIPDIGRIYKLRVWHDDSRPFSGWHLDKIILEPVTTKKTATTSYTFICQKWIDSSDGELIRELPATGTGIKRPQPVVRYLVTVATGDKRGAGTDADVFCCLYGEQGDTGDRPLLSSKNSRNKFERKSVDEFIIEAVTLKNVNKVKIGHNDSGVASGWFLDKVEVREEGGQGLKIFPCGRWLATDEDDGAIVRELTDEGSPQLLNTTSYHVSVKTGDIRGAGTDANVHVKIFGENGDTGKLKLHQSDNIRNKFERGRTDLFKLEATDIGKVERIYIGHDDGGVASGWFLDGVEIDVPSNGMHYTFNCHRWLASDEGDGKTEVELYPTQTRQQDKLLPYEITVTTGDVFNAGTDANVTLQLYGEDGKSESIKLRNRTDNFERNAVDKFKIESKDVGPITKVRIGHDGKGVGSGWFLESLKIQRFVKKTSKRKKRRKESVSAESAEVETYWFVCRRWFDKSEDDGLLIRELVPTDESGRPIDDALQEMEYTVDVYTGDKYGAGTNSNVFLTLYGENGDSGERQLSKSETNFNKFERNQLDTFKLKAADLSILKKLKIRHDNSEIGAAWFLDRVEVKVQGQAWVFPCQRWLSTKEDDGQIERTLVPVDQATYQRLQQQQSTRGKKKTAVRDAVALETKAQLTTYEVTVKTGDVRSAGTDANVYLVLYGENDDSGLVNLKTSKTYRDKFERNHADVFTVESADLGNLKKMKIGHDNAGLTAGWYLEYVEVDAPSLGKKWRFPCGRWIATDKDDGKLERELFPSSDDTVDYAAKVPYEVTVFTSDVSGSGTDADVYVVLYGRDGSQTEQASLCANKDERKSKFNKRSVDTFVLELDDIGETIEKLRIGHDGKGWGAGWHLDKVQIRRLLDGTRGSETYLFTCGRWLARDEDDGEIVRELVPTQLVKEQMTRSGKMKRTESRLEDSLKSQKYRVHVFTGDVFNAGTDANVYLTMFGENGDSGERKLLKSETNTDKFERGKVDIFNLEAVDLGKLYKVHIRHDNALINPSWFLGRIEIEDVETGERFVFHCERWLAKGKDDGKIARSLYVVGYDGETSTKRSLLTTKSGSSLGKKSIMSDTIPEGPTIPYTVRIRTGSDPGAACDVNAFIKIYGPSKKSGSGKVTRRIILEPPTKKFKKGTVETFNIEAIDVGSIKKIELGHTGVDNRWFVEEIMIDQPTMGKSFTFPCKKWFARDKEEGVKSRIIHVEDAEVIKYKAKIPYQITLYTGDVAQAGTDCMITLNIYGSKGSAKDVTIRKSEEEGILLERGSVDVANIELDDIAPLKMVRVSHEGKGQRPDWYCDKIELRNVDSGKVTVFPCNSWISRTMGEKTLSRELSASVGGRAVMKRTSYKLFVKTSNLRGAGTNANVSCIVFGQYGDTGELKLKESDSKKSKFERDSTDVFTFNDKLQIGELQKMRVWHDSKGFGAGWHLEYIEVMEGDRKFMFPCNRWLADDEDDKQIIRELTCINANIQDTASTGGRQMYTVTFSTSDRREAAPSGDAWIVFHGKTGAKSKKLRIDNGGKRRNLVRGQKSSFKLESKDVGPIQQITIGLVDMDRWHIGDVTIESSSGGQSVAFCNAWVNNADGNDTHGRTFDCTTTRGRAVSVASLSPVKYEVVVVTADEKGAGTDANVSITIYGNHGDSGKRPLKQRFRDLFERNQTDKFALEILDLGDLTKIRLEHDDSGFNADWLCDHVIIRNSASGQSWTFLCREWIGNKKASQLFRDVMLTSTS
uniref:Lipoxygenase homology domain-containing protein 1-like n=1 Tax=Phallusia mammillata TaxID=59560 RepID=A0A6F9DJV1_9ASCI|nr:lipoxygenase homology domain-containing protein 1-like [Phallusia mammillata]